MRCKPLLLNLIACVIYQGVPGADRAAAGTPGVSLDGGQFQVNSVTSLSQARADVALDLKGNAVVVWQSAATVVGGTDTADTSIQGQRFDAFGLPVGGQFQVNSYTSGSQTLPAVAAAPDGRFLVVWQGPGDSSGDAVHGRLFPADGAPGAEFLVNNLEAGVQSSPDVAILTTGQFVVVWESFGSGGSDSSLTSVQQRRFDGNGAAVGAQVQVNSFTGGFQTLPSVSAGRRGGYTVAWVSDLGGGATTGRYSARGQAFTATAAQSGTEVVARTTDNPLQLTRARVAMQPDDSFLLSWSSLATDPDPAPWGIEGRKFAAGGVSPGLVFSLPDFRAADQTQSTLASLSRGGFLAAWQ
ncbi:MAG: hypothetical protein ABI639_13890, partial [Thermoanaerobaculia bacterium]